MPATLGDCTVGPSDCPFDDEMGREDWGVATGIVAGNKAWTPGSLRIIFPISDEGPRCGSTPLFDPGSDRDAIEYAIALLSRTG